MELRPEQVHGPGEQWQQPEESNSVFNDHQLRFTPFGRLQFGSNKASPAVVKNYGQAYGDIKEQLPDKSVKKLPQEQHEGVPEKTQGEDTSTFDACISSSSGENPYQQKSRPPDGVFTTADAANIDQREEAVRQDRGIQPSEEQLRKIWEETTYSEQQEPPFIISQPTDGIQLNQYSTAAVTAHQSATFVQSPREFQMIYQQYRRPEPPGSDAGASPKLRGERNRTQQTLRRSLTDSKQSTERFSRSLTSRQSLERYPSRRCQPPKCLVIDQDQSQWSTRGTLKMQQRTCGA